MWLTIGLTDWLTPFQLFDYSIYSCQLVRYLDTLRAMRLAFAACYTALRLTETGHIAVVSYKKGTARTLVFRIHIPRRDIAGIDAAVVMLEYRRNVYSIRAWHAVFAVRTSDSRIRQYDPGCMVKKSDLVVSKRLQRRICAQIVAQMFPICHAAQHSQHTFRRSGITERP